MARELGLNRYESLKVFDTGVTDEYVRSTEGFWKQVRVCWRQHFVSADPLQLLDRRDRAKLMGESFELAERSRREPVGADAVAEHVLLYLVPADGGGGEKLEHRP